MGDIKEARLLAHRHVLLNDAGAVLHRRQVACEGDNLAALFHMDVVKWGFPFHCAYSFPFLVSFSGYKKQTRRIWPMPNTAPP